LSSPNNVEENIKNVIETIEKSKASIIDKAAFLAQELWLHQPFVDGNKRTARLMINFLTMKEGYPLFNFSDKSYNFNSLLVEQFIEKNPKLINDFIKKQLTVTMNTALKKETNIEPNKNLGHRMFL
jgi:Fic family protein